MNCKHNCNNIDKSVIMFVRGTTVNLKFTFNIDISSFDSAQFTIRKDYKTAPVINKTVSGFNENILLITLSNEETTQFNEFTNGQNFAQYIWGLNLSKDDEITNVFPQTGKPAPLCIVQKNVVINN